MLRLGNFIGVLKPAMLSVLWGVSGSKLSSALCPFQTLILHVGAEKLQTALGRDVSWAVLPDLGAEEF